MNYRAELNKGMKVFSKLYVGIMPGTNPLGFATPYEETSAGRKRQETVKNWLGGDWEPVIENGRYTYKDGKQITVPRVNNIKIMDNIPRSGFKITDDIKRVYWGGGNVVFRVFDPEGFELEIQSSNLMALIQVSGINEGGVIPGSCIWGRDGGNNILLHDKSEEYKNAILAAETLKKPAAVTAAARVIGSEYLLQDGSTGIYLGKFWVTADNFVDETAGQATMKFLGKIGAASKTSRKIGSADQYEAVLANPHIRELADAHIKFYKKAPLVRPLNTVQITPEIALNTINATERHSFASSSNKDTIRLVTMDRPTSVKYATTPISRKEFEVRLAAIRLNAEREISFARSVWSGSGGSFFRPYSSYCLRNSGKLYTNEFNINIQNDSPATGTRRADGLGLCILQDDMLNSYASQFGYSSFYFGRETVDTLDAFELPMFTNPAELAFWCQFQYDSGNLVKVIVVNNTSNKE